MDRVLAVRAAALATALFLCSGMAAAAAPDTPAVKPLVDLRLRYENVEQDGLPQQADALLARARLGFEAGKLANTSLLAEGEFIWPWRSDYRPDPLLPTRTRYPVVADAEAHEMNRLQLTNTSLPGTTVTLGRQRINLDDQRFVGNVGWRMNEQTFDALRVVNRSVKKLIVDVSYVNQVNRVFGQRSPQSPYEGDSFLGNVAWQFGPGKLTGFAYLVDIDPVAGVPAAVRDASATYGLRFAGETPLGQQALSYVLSWAKQRDYAGNPLRFDLDYLLAEAGYRYGSFTAGAGYERLEGDGVKGFTTPLATLHRFQGWADKFLTTPVNGIQDLYVSAGWGAKKLGVLEALSFTAVWHELDAQRGPQSYGSELDLQLQGRVGRVTGLVKYADYHAQALFTDTRKLWLQLEFAY